MEQNVSKIKKRLAKVIKNVYLCPARVNQNRPLVLHFHGSLARMGGNPVTNTILC